ncbi:hypothetical protein ACFVZH_20755 [Streptomyces sp. NPDC059534]|uniref:hypothetical protein n=1 Tax=Streptomyces sp. NPDC059534 TaxID=3346859 RepID=UPI00368DD20D
MTQPEPAEQDLVDRIAAAIYEWSCQPYKWSDAHPDDLLAYRADAHAVMKAVVRPLLERASKADTRARALGETLDNVLRQFVHKGHPGEPCLQTGWVRERDVQQWRDTLYGPKETP